jgi:cytochrome c oxidase subunit 3
MSEHAEHHEWEVSPWPLTVSVGILFIPLAFSFQFVYAQPLFAMICAGIATVLILMSITGWVTETVGVFEEGYAPTAMLIFIISESFIFLAFFATYWANRLQAATWPPEGSIHMDPTMSFIGIGILLVGAVALHKASGRYETDPGSCVGNFWIGAFTGILFLGLFAMEWSTMIGEGFTVGTNILSTTVYALGGWHASHVLIGLAMWVMIAIPTAKGNTSPSFVKAALMYWDFVLVVSLFVTLQVYMW